ncbi:hypothetical protein NRB_26980 [Novosphingobium sp. 11B]
MRGESSIEPPQPGRFQPPPIPPPQPGPYWACAEEASNEAAIPAAIPAPFRNFIVFRSEFGGVAPKFYLMRAATCPRLNEDRRWHGCPQRPATLDFVAGYH